MLLVLSIVCIGETEVTDVKHEANNELKCKSLLFMQYYMYSVMYTMQVRI